MINEKKEHFLPSGNKNKKGETNFFFILLFGAK